MVNDNIIHILNTFCTSDFFIFVNMLQIKNCNLNDYIGLVNKKNTIDFVKKILINYEHTLGVVKT